MPTVAHIPGFDRSLLLADEQAFSVASSEVGFSMIELLVAMVLFMLVAGAAFGALTDSMGNEQTAFHTR